MIRGEGHQPSLNGSVKMERAGTGAKMPSKPEAKSDPKPGAGAGGAGSPK